MMKKIFLFLSIQCLLLDMVFANTPGKLYIADEVGAHIFYSVKNKIPRALMHVEKPKNCSHNIAHIVELPFQDPKKGMGRFGIAYFPSSLKTYQKQSRAIIENFKEFDIEPHTNYFLKVEKIGNKITIKCTKYCGEHRDQYGGHLGADLNLYVPPIEG